jgi:hypothetical protein
MAFAICRIEKYQASLVRGIEIHDMREKPSKSNPDIDRDKSAENVMLVKSEDWAKSINERLAKLDLKKAIRKDAVVMCQAMITTTHGGLDHLDAKGKSDYFTDSLRFLQERYGKDNIFSAVIHMDEKTPHMHVNFTPIRDGRLSAKAIFDRKELTSLQTDFHREVASSRGLERGEERQEGQPKRRHQDVAMFKRTTAQAELENVQAELAKAKAQAGVFAVMEKNRVDLEIKTMKLQEEADRLSSISALKISENDFQQKIIGRKHKLFSTEDIYETLEDVKERIENNYIKPREYENLKLKKEVDYLKNENEKLKKHIEPWSKIESSLSKEQIEKIQYQAGIEAQSYRDANEIKLKTEKERKTFENEMLKTKRLGGFSILGDKIKLVKEIMLAWDKAQDKRTFENDVREQLSKGQSRGRSR